MDPYKSPLKSPILVSPPFPTKNLGLLGFVRFTLKRTRPRANLEFGLGLRAEHLKILALGGCRFQIQPEGQATYLTGSL